MQTEEEQETLPSNLQVEGEEAQRKLVILGIPWETTSESMRAYFSRFCPVQVCLARLGSSAICGLLSLPHRSRGLELSCAARFA